jgi:hypothetical protein
MYKIKNSVILDFLNEKSVFDDNIVNKKELFKCPMIPSDEDVDKMCGKCKRIAR